VSLALLSTIYFALIRASLVTGRIALFGTIMYVGRGAFKVGEKKGQRAKACSAGKDTMIEN